MNHGVGWQEIPATRRMRDGSVHSLALPVAEEVAVAISYNTFQYAVMMATPADLEDFAIGFSMAEGFARPSDILSITISDSTEDSVTVDVTLAAPALHTFLARRRIRNRVSHGGCGVCGVDDIDAALAPCAISTNTFAPIEPASVLQALRDLRALQVLGRLTHGAHAAAWVSDDGIIRLIREDVGRHNALDKLIGAHAQSDVFHGSGFCIVTSRCCVELVQKAASAGIRTLVAISAPTRLAISHAQKAGITLLASARDEGFTIYTDQATGIR